MPQLDNTMNISDNDINFVANPHLFPFFGGGGWLGELSSLSHQTLLTLQLNMFIPLMAFANILMLLVSVLGHSIVTLKMQKNHIDVDWRVLTAIVH